MTKSEHRQLLELRRWTIWSWEEFAAELADWRSYGDAAEALSIHNERIRGSFTASGRYAVDGVVTGSSLSR